MIRIPFVKIAPRPTTKDASAIVRTRRARRAAGWRRDTRARCERCGLAERCPDRRPRGGVCVYEGDRFPELDDPREVPSLLADVLRSELVSYFRGKRVESWGSGKIDMDASRLATAIVKECAEYVEISHAVRTKFREPPAEENGVVPALYPSLEAAVRASEHELFSEVPDPVLRARLVRAYIAALEREEEVLREVARAAGGRGGSGGGGDGD